jgi:cytochrome oxidase assembly protein ShyY1
MDVQSSQSLEGFAIGHNAAASLMADIEALEPVAVVITIVTRNRHLQYLQTWIQVQAAQLLT